MSQDTRVFGIGMNKTGTSSLGRCLRALGITPVPSQYDIKTADLIDPILLDGNYEPALGFARSYRGFEDRPWNVWDMYRRLDERYPESLFVLTVRDVDKWWRSVHRWLTVVKPNIRERYMLHLRAESFTREDFVRGYEAYNREVGAYFEDGRADRLLVIDFAEGRGWEPLCAFLDRPVPADRPFPHVNRQGYRSAARRQARDGRPLDLERCFSCGHSAAMERVEAGEDEPESRRFEALRRPLAQLRNRILKQQQSSRSYSERRLHRLRSAMPQLRIDDLAVVTAYYNPGRSKQRLANLHRFNDGMRRSGVPLLTVELAFKDRRHEASGLYGDLLELRAEHVMWHKERLLNIGIRSLLDRGFRKIVWLDSDVLFFEAENWPWHVAAELERSHVCQVFSRVLLQKRHGQPATLSVSGVRYFRDRGKLVGQNAVFPTLRWPGFYLDGQTGFGWAARAGLLEQVPLYDAGVVGGGDKMIYVASFCDSEDRWHAAAKLVRSRNAPCPRCNHVSQATLYTQDYLAWAERWAKAVGGKVGYADLAIRDLFHGEREHKRYRDRKQILLNYDYDPATDLEQNADGCWKWSSDKGGLHADVKQYFRERRES